MYTSLINKVILPLSDKILGLTVNEELEYYRKVQWLSKEKLKNIQKKKIKESISTC